MMLCHAACGRVISDRVVMENEENFKGVIGRLSKVVAAFRGRCSLGLPLFL